MLETPEWKKSTQPTMKNEKGPRSRGQAKTPTHRTDREFRHSIEEGQFKRVDEPLPGVMQHVVNILRYIEPSSAVRSILERCTESGSADDSFRQTPLQDESEVDAGRPVRPVIVKAHPPARMAFETA